ncbi:pyruvate formate lyase activating enzyme [Thermosulfidibacter takaii ABI70S6]|uniref:Pyruvate formate lyase activating enzyme n=2 Tax=Thermosulfidibacter takaii TaxID=412593 RepID=A0A0S3QT18_THET7|nr:pyruvate formate lyase activating enzyme [Thermosulfidibacter takaii ABI70S6]
MKPVAKYWEALENKKVKCLLCPRGCIIAEGKRGFCRVRGNIDGKLVALGYGEVVSIANDPIEKKPLYHFYPGSYIISTACNGCNLGCLHCQNYEISQFDCPTRYVSPEDMVELAIRHKSKGICFTYTEPLVWFEYIMDVAKIAKDYDLPIVLVSNGQINEEPFLELIPYIDAMNIDLKSISSEFYEKICRGGSLEATLRTIRLAFEHGVHVEVTNLIIPTLNDSKEDIEQLVDFMVSVSPDIPLHFTRFYPYYKLTNLPPTPLETLLTAREIALAKRVKYVYVGNVPDDRLNSTYCPSCGRLLIKRTGFFETYNYLEKDRCPQCGEKVYGRF